MIEPTFVTDGAGRIRALRTLKKSVQGGQNPGHTLGSRDPTMVNANANGGQAKPLGGDAASRAGCASVRDKAIGQIGRIPKVIEIGLLDVI